MKRQFTEEAATKVRVALSRFDVAGITALLSKLPRQCSYKNYLRTINDEGIKDSTLFQLIEDLNVSIPSLELNFDRDTIESSQKASPSVSTPYLPPKGAKTKNLKSRVFLILVFASLLVSAFAVWRLIQMSTQQIASVDEVSLSMSVLPRGKDKSIPIEIADLPIKPGDSVQFHAFSAKPCYFYLIWLDSLGKVTPIWPWKDLTWQDTVSSVATNEFQYPEGVAHYELQPDSSGIHAVILFASPSPIVNLVGLRDYLESLKYKQESLSTINSQTLAVIQNGNLVLKSDRGPLLVGRTKDASNPVSVLQAGLPPVFLKDVAITSVCFAFEGNSTK